MVTVETPVPPDSVMVTVEVPVPPDSVTVIVDIPVPPDSVIVTVDIILVPDSVIVTVSVLGVFDPTGAVPWPAVIVVMIVSVLPGAVTVPAGYVDPAPTTVVVSVTVVPEPSDVELHDEG
ncbi:uncharacterized protein F4807DRAFT_435034 [Annulohypoxylon truncatum]|uniref:uncharacterized protein n=1 Tax=Annulohypoxylon truncatum TaxID=327061 RepID=UPI002008BCF4|nr:uncharacterized protein F4807DRAFT_435034 [Annulohypoxylon truncatum]KAI1207547.1 hypothetical protein F4807DRAFT_435034 [Annulohypoxylon truncatum]